VRDFTYGIRRGRETGRKAEERGERGFCSADTANRRYKPLILYILIRAQLAIKYKL